MSITETTELRLGLQLSDNVSLDLLTRGPANPVTYPFNIMRTSHLYNEGELDIDSEWTQGGHNPLLPQKYKIAQNLEMLSTDIVETLISEYSTELMLFAAYLSPKVSGRNGLDPRSKHFTGEAIDISLSSYEHNVFKVAGQIRKMFAGKISEMGLIFNQRSWIHLGIRGPNAVTGGDPQQPRFFTKDVSLNQSWSGFYPARGMY